MAKGRHFNFGFNFFSKKERKASVHSNQVQKESVLVLDKIKPQEIDNKTSVSKDYQDCYKKYILRQSISANCLILKVLLIIPA